MELKEGKDFVLTLLLNIASLSLEAGVQGLTIDEQITSDNTHRGSLSEHIQQSSLSSAAHTHQSSKSTRLDPTSDVIQKPSGLTLDLNVIDKILPGKDISLWLHGGKSSSIRVSGHGEFLVDSTPVDTTLEVGGNVTALEDENLSLARGLGVELSRDKVDDHETDEESEEDTEVAPDVGIVVLVVGLNEGVTIDSVLASHSTDGGTDPGVARERCICWDDGRASKVSAVKFVGDENLEAVENRVDPPTNDQLLL